MSFQAMTWALEQKTSNAGQKLVLLMLANYCNSHSGQCNPSHKRLAAECCMGESTLKRHIQSLSDAGLLRVLHRAADGVSLPNQYVLIFDVGGSKLDGGVGPNRAGGGSKLDPGVGPNWATNQEFKPVIEPLTPTPLDPPTPADEGGFDGFWAAYPATARKTAKRQCAAKWVDMGCAGIAGAVLAGLAAAKKSPDWAKNDGEYIPAPLVWLNQRRWEAFAKPVGGEYWASAGFENRWEAESAGCFAHNAAAFQAGEKIQK